MVEGQGVVIARRMAAMIDSSNFDMVLVTGSAARGLSDRSSDVDLYLYRSDVVSAAGSLKPSLARSGATLIFGHPTATGRFEKFQLDGRYIDVEQVGTEILDAIAGRIEAGMVDIGDIKTIVGVRDAIALAGTEALRTWQGRLTLTDDVAISEARRLTGRILPLRALYDLTWARSDEISYFARVTPVLLAGLGLLGAVNRQWVSTDDPKWLPWQIERLGVTPPDLLDGFRAALTTPTPQSVDIADGLLSEILNLVDERIDGADTRAARFALRLRATPRS